MNCTRYQDYRVHGKAKVVENFFKGVDTLNNGWNVKFLHRFDVVLRENDQMTIFLIQPRDGKMEVVGQRSEIFTKTTNQPDHSIALTFL